MESEKRNRILRNEIARRIRAEQDPYSEYANYRRRAERKAYEYPADTLDEPDVEEVKPVLLPWWRKDYDKPWRVALGIGLSIVAMFGAVGLAAQ